MDRSFGCSLWTPFETAFTSYFDTTTAVLLIILAIVLVWTHKYGFHAFDTSVEFYETLISVEFYLTPK